MATLAEIACSIGIAAFCPQGDNPPSQVDPGKIDPDFYNVRPQPIAPAPPPPGRLDVPGALTFSPVRLGEEKTAFVTVPLLNTGGRPYRINNVTIAGSNEFALKNSCEVIQKGGTCSVSIEFSPRYSGEYLAELLISGEDESHKVSLIAKAIEPPPPPPAPKPEPKRIVKAAPPPPQPDYFKEALVAALEEEAATPAPLGGTSMVIPAPKAPKTIALKPLPKGPPDWHLMEKKYPGQGEKGSFGRDIATFPVERCRIIPRDSMIRLVMDFTLNSQIGGRVKAHVDRDVYGPDGRLVLLPWGTSFIGTFEPLEKQGDTKIEISWDQITRPDGSAVALAGTAAHDIMGRQGVVGDIDNRWFEKYGTVAGLTAISTAVAYGSAGSSSTSTDTTTVTGNDELTAAGQALQQSLAQVTADALRQNFNLAPRVTVRKGTVLFAVPNQDWYFPNAFEVVEVDPTKANYTYDCSGEFFRYRNGVNQNSNQGSR